MSSVVSSLLGTSGGAGGTGFAGPSSAGIINPATQAQADQLYGQGQTAIGNQADFLQAVQAQNGLGNQSNVFGQLQGVANGTSPNPAQAQLAQATGANIANQSAMAAGQRGASANVGMMQRNAANQGAGIQQQAAGQAATMQAQQSLGALNQMGSMANQQAAQQAAATGAYTGAVQGQQSQTLGAVQGQNNANVGMQSNINTGNTGMATTRMGGQANMVGNIMGGIGSAFGLAEGGVVPKMADGGDVQQPAQPSAPTVGAHKSKVGQYFANMQSGDSKQPDGSAIAGQAIGKGIGTGMKAGWNAMFGPSSTTSATPGNVAQTTQNAQMFDANRPDMLEGTAQTGSDAIPDNLEMAADGGIAGLLGTVAKLAPLLAAEGGKVPALLSPGEQYIPPEDVHKVAKGADPLKTGERIPGKPKHPGNDYRNDVVPKTLKEGGIVIPNEIMQSKNPHWGAHKFVLEHMAKQGLKPTLKGKKKS